MNKVTQIITAMITVYGMNKRVGQVYWSETEQGFTKPYSEATARIIDEEVKLMVDQMYTRTMELLLEKKDLVAGKGQ